MADLNPGRTETNTLTSKHDFSGSTPAVAASGPFHENGTRETHNALKAILINELEIELQALNDTIGDVDDGFEESGTSYRLTIGDKIRKLSDDLINVSATNFSSEYLYRIFGTGVFKRYESEYDISVKFADSLVLSLGAGAIILPTSMREDTSANNITISATGRGQIGTTDGTQVIDGESHTLSGAGPWTITLANRTLIREGIGNTDGWGSTTTVLVYNSNTLNIFDDNVAAVTVDTDNAKNGTVVLDNISFSNNDVVKVMYKYHKKRSDKIQIRRKDDGTTEISVIEGTEVGPNAALDQPAVNLSDTTTEPLWYINIDPFIGYYDEDDGETESSIILDNNMFEDLRSFIMSGREKNGNQIDSVSIGTADNGGRKTKLLIDEIDSINPTYEFGYCADPIGDIDFLIDYDGDNTHKGSISSFGSFLAPGDCTGTGSFVKTSGKTADDKTYGLKVKFNPISEFTVSGEYNLYITIIDTDSATEDITIYFPAFDTNISSGNTFWVADDGSTYYDSKMTNLAKANPFKYLISSQVATMGAGIKTEHIQDQSVSEDKIAPYISTSITKAPDLGILPLIQDTQITDRTLIAAIPAEDLTTDKMLGVDKITESYAEVDFAQGKYLNISVLKNIPGATHGVAIFTDVGASTAEIIKHSHTGDYGVYIQLVPVDQSLGESEYWHDLRTWITVVSDNTFTINISGTGTENAMVEYIIIPEEHIISNTGSTSATIVNGMALKTTGGAVSLIHNLGTISHAPLITFSADPTGTFIYHIVKGADEDTLYLPVDSYYFTLKLQDA